MRIVLVAIEGEKLTFRLRGLTAVDAELIHASLPFLGGFKIPQKI